MSSSRDDLDRAFHLVSTDNHAGWVVATSCIFAIFSVVSLVAKLLVSRQRSKRVPLYDTLLIAATLLALAQTVCIVSACDHGLGKHRKDVGDESFDSFEKFLYTASILLLASQALSKASIAHFIAVLTPHQIILRLCHGTLAVILLWAISGIVALALQCQVPTPWKSAPGACINQLALHIYIGLVNILTDAALIALPTQLLLKTRSKARYQVIGLFATRVVVPIVTIAYLVSLVSSFSSTSDPTRNAVMPTIWSQIMLHLSIITGCIPGLKRVLDAYRSDAAAVSISPPYEVAFSKGNGLEWLKRAGGLTLALRSRSGRDNKSRDSRRRSVHHASNGQGVELKNVGRRDGRGSDDESGIMVRPTVGSLNRWITKSSLTVDYKTIRIYPPKTDRASMCLYNLETMGRSEASVLHVGQAMLVKIC